LAAPAAARGSERVEAESVRAALVRSAETLHRDLRAGDYARACRSSEPRLSAPSVFGAAVRDDGRDTGGVPAPRRAPCRPLLQVLGAELTRRLPASAFHVHSPVVQDDRGRVETSLGAWSFRRADDGRWSFAGFA